MRARTAVTAAALATAAALVLTACGGGSGGDDKITSSPSTATTSASPSAPAGPADSASLRIDPSLALPADVKVAFQWTTPKDPTRAAALSGAANFVQAIDHAVVKQNKNDPGLRGYAADDALAYARNFVQENVDAKVTLSGTDRYYEPVFDTGTAGTQSVRIKLCNDQSKLYSKDIATGKVEVTGPSDRNYVLYDIVMVKLPAAKDLWQARGITVKEKSLQCKQ